MEKQKVLITVKTYPTISQTYAETVCTAGVKEDGSWVRIYPVPFRRLDEIKRYKKFDWIECRLRQSRKDWRPESFNPMDGELTRIKHLGTGIDRKWRERRRILLRPNQVFDRLSSLISEAKTNRRSLAIFKPTDVIDFIWKEEEREWDAKKLHAIHQRLNQEELFEDNKWKNNFDIIPKLPYSFSYVFKDVEGKESTLKILDWEIGALYWNCLKSTGNNEAKAIDKVKAKYFHEFAQKDLHFFVGTTLRFHSVSPNPWLIIGVFPAPFDDQLSLY